MLEPALLKDSWIWIMMMSGRETTSLIKALYLDSTEC